MGKSLSIQRDHCGQGRGKGKQARWLQRKGVTNWTELQDRERRKDARYVRAVQNLFGGTALPEEAARQMLRGFIAAEESARDKWVAAKQDMNVPSRMVEALHMKFRTAAGIRASFQKQYGI